MAEITEFTHRDYRIIHTTDPKVLGATHDDRGFPILQGWVVRDAFDENPIPHPTTWFYRPDDAVMAVEIIDGMKNNPSPWRSFSQAYYGTMHLRNHMLHVVVALHAIETLCRDAESFGDNPGAAVLDRLHMLKASTMLPGYPASTK